MKNPLHTVCVVGLGYIGLPTAAFFAAHGKTVIGVDINQSHVDKINQGIVPFYEPDFEELLARVVASNDLTAQTDIPAADVYVVAVPTPFNDDHTIDTRFIEAAASSIAPKLSGGELVILESTSPPGTTEFMAEVLSTANSSITIHTDTSADSDNAIFVAHCPERVLPGKIVQEMADNDRVVGGLSETATQLAAELYRSFCVGDILLTDAKTAEMAKLTENAFRDVNIAFANELSVICDRLNIDVWELIDIANHHPRVNILKPGPGVGGHCIAVDPWFIVSAAPDLAELLRTSRKVNDSKPSFVLNQVNEALAQSSATGSITVLGIAFKPDIDDLRESPSLDIAAEIARTNPERTINIIEPNITELPASLQQLPNVALSTLTEALPTTEVAVLLVDHKEFRELDGEVFTNCRLIDCKGLWTGKTVRKFN